MKQEKDAPAATNPALRSISARLHLTLVGLGLVTRDDAYIKRMEAVAARLAKKPRRPVLSSVRP